MHTHKPGKVSNPSPPAVASRGQQPSQRGPTPPNRGQDDYQRSSQGYPSQQQVQMNVQSMIFNHQGMLQQQQQQQGQPQRMPQPFYPRGMPTRPLRIQHQHPQATNQPMYQSPPGVGVPQVIQMPAGGPQYTISPQQYAVNQVDYQTVQVGNQPIAYRSPAPQMSGPYNQVPYQNYSASASMPPPMYASQPQMMFVRGNPPMQNIPNPQQYQQARPEQPPPPPRKKNIIQIKDPNQDNKDVTSEILSQSTGNATTSGSPGLASDSNVSGQSSTSNTPPINTNIVQETASTSKDGASLRAVFAAQVAATLNDESESTKEKSKVTIPQVTAPIQTTKSTSPKHPIGEVKIISIEKKNSRTVELPKKDEPKVDVAKPVIKPAEEVVKPEITPDTTDNAISVVDGAQVSTEAKPKDSIEVKMENSINTNTTEPSISNKIVPQSTVEPKAVAVADAKQDLPTDTMPDKKTESKPAKEQLSLASEASDEESKLDKDNLPNGSISPVPVSEEIVRNEEVSQELEMAPPVEETPNSDIKIAKEEEITKVQTESCSDVSVSKTVEPEAQNTQSASEEGTVNGVEIEPKAKQPAVPGNATTDLSMKEHKRKKLNKRLKEIDKKPDQADLMDAYTEAPPIKDVKEEPKEDNKESKKEEREEQVPSEEETWEDKDEKSVEGMWSPEQDADESKNGPRFYDRDFLLQFQFNPVCTEKPKGLPDIEVVLQTSVANRPQLKQPFANRVGGGGGGGGGVDSMMPSYMRQRGGPGSGQSMARSNKGRVPAKKVIHTIEQKVELNKSENRWVRPSEASKNLGEEEKKTLEIMRKFRGILNKLTPQKFGTLIQQVLDLEIDTAERLEEVISIIFEKALNEPSFSVAYANMCRCLIPTNVKVETKDGKDTTLTFRKILLNKCQKEFEREKTDEINIHEKMEELLKQGLSIKRLRIGHDARGPGKGIFVEEVDVLPADGERATFPCSCWLAEDKSDSKLERDVIPGKPKPPRPNVSYHLAIKTADVPNAGTDANVYFQLIGEEAETEKIQLRQGGKSEKRFERGRTDKFIVETVDVGKIKHFRIGHDDKGLASGWKLDQVSVEVPSRNEKLVFPCNRWLDATEDDKKIERDLVPGVPGIQTTTTTTTPTGPPTPSRSVSKTVVEKTTTTFQTSQGRYSTPQKPPAPKRLIMDEETRYGTTPPPAKQRQVVEEETKYKTISTPSNTTPTPNTITTQEIRYGTTPSKRVIIEEEVRYKKPIVLTPQDKLREERIRIERSAPQVEETPPPRPAPPSDRDDRVDVSVRSYREPQETPGDVSNVEPRKGYIERRTETETVTRDLIRDVPEQPKVVAYQLCLKMGDVLGDGTEGNVYIQLVGAKGMTEQIMLRQDGNSKIKFEKGRTYKFTIETVDIGPIEKVLISHDGEQGRGGWYLEEVTVDVPSRDEHVVFPCMSWLAAEEGDGKTMRELNAKPAVYHLKIKTGILKNAGTDANVWTRIYGDKGDTGKIELQRSGIMETLFEPDQTDYFTVSANDIGKVEAISVGHDGANKPGTRWYLEEIVLNSPHKGEHYIFPCRAWIPDADGKNAEVQLVPQTPIQNYSITLKTGQRKNAGTDSNVYMQLFGDRGDTGVVELRQVCEPTGMLQKGSHFQFNMQTTDVGNLDKVRIGHDGTGLGTGWFLEEVVIMVQDECWVFPCNRWLADYEDDGKTERDLYPERKTYAHEPDLQDLIEYLQTDDVNLVVNSAFYIQHLCYNDEAVKSKIRELGGIPVLVRLLDHEAYAVHRAAASCLRNVSYSKDRDENKLAIAECYGIETLIRLLQKTPKDESGLRFVARRDVIVYHSARTTVRVPVFQSNEKEVKELVLGVLWNLSSCDILKIRIIRYCLIILVTLIIIPYSGWDKEIFQSGKPIPAVKWSAVFRNASGILRNLSSAGVEARKEMRACVGLVDSLVWIIYAPVAKTDVDNKSVENSVCTLRNLSYRLEDEINRERYEDASQPTLPQEEKKPVQPGCMAVCGGAKKGKHFKQPEEKRPPAEGVELLWQPEIVKPYLSIMAEASNPDTIEGVAGALHNLMACNWEWAVVIRSAVRKDKGLPIMVELLRMEHDPVVRATATCLRNLAIDPRNKELIGKFAMKDLVRRLPDPPKDEDDTPYNSTTVGPLLCAIHQVINGSLPNGKHCREKDGFKKIVAIANSKDKYPEKVVKTANQVLMTLWAFTALRNSIKKEGWELTKEVTDEYGPPPAAPRAFDDISLPRNSHRKKNRIPEPIRAEESSLPDPPRRADSPQRINEDGYEADDDKNRNKPAPKGSQEEIEMQDLQGNRSPPAYESDPAREEPQYAEVDKSKKIMKLKGEGGANSDSWV